jgi:cell fate (sporulation/competence/biofilm development) regulator YlbF (YheA/YmcA/DUF963 family)
VDIAIHEESKHPQPSEIPLSKELHDFTEQKRQVVTDDESRKTTRQTTQVSPTLSQLTQQASTEKNSTLVKFSSHQLENQSRKRKLSLDSNISVFLNNKNRYDIEKLFQIFVSKYKILTTERYFWKQIPKLSERFLDKIENNKIFNFSDLNHLKMRDFFTAFLYLNRQNPTLSLA